MISLIVPTRNEAGNIAELVRRINVALTCPHEIVIVDDSTDNTPNIARQLGCKVVKGRHLGLAQAVIDGIEASVGDAVIIMDADLQHPPELLPEVVEKLKIHDLVVVSKHTKDSISDLSLWRKLQSNLGCFAAKMLVPISDPMTGFFAIRKSCLDGVKLDAIGFKIGLEIFCKANWTSHCEVPMKFDKRRAGKSKGTMQGLQKHLWRLYKSSLKHRITLPAGSDEWNAFYEGNSLHRAWKQRIANVIGEVTALNKPSKTLDCGCGSSANINYIATGAKVGLDIRKDAIEFMRGHSDALFGYGSILAIPFGKEVFDCVVCSEVIEHLYPDETERGVSELARVLRNGGIAIISTPNYSSLLWNLTEKAQQLFQPRHWVDDHHSKFNRKSLNELCGKYGLREIRYDGIIGNSDMVVTFQKEE